MPHGNLKQVSTTAKVVKKRDLQSVLSPEKKAVQYKSAGSSAGYHRSIKNMLLQPYACYSCYTCYCNLRFQYYVVQHYELNLINYFLLLIFYPEDNTTPKKRFITPSAPYEDMPKRTVLSETEATARASNPVPKKFHFKRREENTTSLSEYEIETSERFSSSGSESEHDDREQTEETDVYIEKDAQEESTGESIVSTHKRTTQKGFTQPGSPHVATSPHVIKQIRRSIVAGSTPSKAYR
jgi:hypothetical protein